MKNHVLRPLITFIGIIALILLARIVLVPKDFGSYERGYMYSWHRKANEEDWKKVKVKYQGAEYCKDCHADNYDKLKTSPHKVIQCENCHGPAGDEKNDHYSEQRPKLAVDRSRAHCLRCHFPLPYPTSGRAKIKGIDPETHNPGADCSSCHNPHKPMEGLR